MGVSAAECLELIERHRVTHAPFVPTLFVRMLKLPAADVSGLLRETYWRNHETRIV